MMDFPLPELGEGVYEAETVRWLVKTGDVVKPGQTLLEVLTDKATMEVPAPFGGVIQKLLVQPGQKVTIGQSILQYEGKAPAAKSAEAVAESKSVKPITAPMLTTPPPSVYPPHPRPLSPGVPGERGELGARDNGPAAVGVAVKAAPSVRLMARRLGIDLR